MRLVCTLWRDFTAQESPSLVSVSAGQSDRAGCGSAAGCASLFCEVGKDHRDNEGSAVCPLGCEQELWLMVKVGASSGDATKHSWKGCGGLGIVSWLLLVVLRVITAHFNPFLSLCT